MCGFVPLTDKLLAQCRKATPTVTRPLRISLDGRQGTLFIGQPGTHFIKFDDSTVQADPGVDALEKLLETAKPDNRTARGSLLALWRYLDLFSPGRPDDLMELLLHCGIDLNRRGWVRLDASGDELAVTVGAQGESEADFPQMWIDKSTHRMLKLSLPDGSSAFGGPLEPDGLPQWIALNNGAMKLSLLGADCPGKKK